MRTLPCSVVLLVLSVPVLAGNMTQVTSGAFAFEGGPQEVSLSGNGLLQVSQVALVRTGFNPIVADNLVLMSDHAIRMRFNVGVGLVGRWAVQASFRDGSASTIMDAVEVLPMDLRSIGPQPIGNSGEVRLEVIGKGFENVGQVVLVAPNGAAIPSTSIVAVDPMRSIAAFSLSQVPTGMYGLRIVHATRPETTRDFANRLAVQPIVVGRVSPTRVAIEDGTVTLQIAGGGFEAATLRSITLARPDRAIAATSFQVLSAGRIEATFTWPTTDGLLANDLFSLRVEELSSMSELPQAVRLLPRSVVPLRFPRTAVGPGASLTVRPAGVAFPAGATVRLTGPTAPWQSPPPPLRTVDLRPQAIDAQTLSITVPSDLAAGRYSVTVLDGSGRLWGLDDLLWVGRVSYAVTLDPRPVRLGGVTTLWGAMQNTGTLPLSGTLGIYGTYMTRVADSWSRFRSVRAGESLTFSCDVKALTMEEIQAIDAGAVDPSTGTVQGSMHFLFDGVIAYTPQGGGYDDDGDGNGGVADGGPGSTIPVPLGGSQDPNAKMEGHARGLVPEGETLSYTISFENAKGALFAADTVEVEDWLPAELDWRTFQAGPVSHADRLASLDYDAATGKATWTFIDINLPPNVDAPKGEGFVKYTVRARTGLANGTRVTNRARIRFDANPAVPVVNTVTIVTASAAMPEAEDLAAGPGSPSASEDSTAGRGANANSSRARQAEETRRGTGDVSTLDDPVREVASILSAEPTDTSASRGDSRPDPTVRRIHPTRASGEEMRRESERLGRRSCLGALAQIAFGLFSILAVLTAIRKYIKAVHSA